MKTSTFKVISFCLASVLSTAVCAGSYQAEVNGTLGRVDVDGGGNQTVLGVGGEFFFAPVDTTGKPLAESAFLNKASGINAEIVTVNGDNSDVTNTSIGADIYIPSSIVFLGVDYTRTDADDWDDSTWSVTGGVTPIDGLLVTTTYVEDNGYDLNVAAKYVMQLGSNQWLNLVGGFTDDDNNTYTAGADYYFTRASSVGFEVTDSGSSTTYTFRGKHFFQESWYVGGYYVSAEYSDAFGAEAGLRF